MVDFRQFYKDKANVAYMVVGYPTLDLSKQFLRNLDKTNIDILELGIPYSDPIADGKIISEAALSALANGADINKVFEILEEVKTKKALVFLVYYNLIFSYGLIDFVQKSKQVGIKALIVPDLPFEENEILFEECEKAGIALIPLVSVTTRYDRIKTILKRASGFVYAVACIGITGGKQVASQRLIALVNDIKTFTNLPVFVGFGIKNAQDVEKTKKFADGAIVGTSIVECFQSGGIKEILSKIDKIFPKNQKSKKQ